MMLLDRRLALLVVDMQSDFVTPGSPLAVPGARELLPTLVSAIDACRAHSIPVIHIVQQLRVAGQDAGPLAQVDAVVDGALREGSAGASIVAELSPTAEETVVIKRRFSGFFQTDLDLVLRTLRITEVALAGVATHVCYDMTARDAAQLGYSVVCLSDGTACGDLPDLGFGPVAHDDVRRVVLTTIARRFGRVCSTGEFLEAVEAGAEDDCAPAKIDLPR